MGKWEFVIRDANRIDQYLALLEIVPEGSEDMEALEEKLTSYMDMPEIREEGEPKFPVQDRARRDLVQYLNWNAKERMKVFSEEGKTPEDTEERKLHNQGVFRYDPVAYQLRGYQKLKEMFSDDFDFDNVESRLTDYTKKMMDKAMNAKDANPKDYVTSRKSSPIKMMNYMNEQDEKLTALLTGKPAKRFHVDEDYYSKRRDMIQASFEKMSVLRDEMKGTKKALFSDSKLFKNMMSSLDSFLEVMDKGSESNAYMSEETVQKYNQVVKACDAYVKARSGSKLTDSGNTRLENATMIADLLKGSPQKYYAEDVAERSALREERAAGKADLEVKTGGSNNQVREEDPIAIYLGRKDCMDYDKMLIELHEGSEDLRKDFAYEYNKLSVRDRAVARRTYESHMELLTQFGRVPEETISLGQLISPDAEKGKGRILEVDESELHAKKRISVESLEKKAAPKKETAKKQAEKAEKSVSTAKKKETTKKAPEKAEPERGR